VLGVGAFGNVLAGEFCSSPVAIKHLRNKLRIMRHICHPNRDLLQRVPGRQPGPSLARAREGGGPEARLFISRLEVWRPDSPFHERQVGIVRGVCQALIYLHSRKPCVVHLDPKPDNIMVLEAVKQSLPPKSRGTIGTVVLEAASRTVACLNTSAGLMRDRSALREHAHRRRHFVLECVSGADARQVAEQPATTVARPCHRLTWTTWPPPWQSSDLREANLAPRT
jgi:hypothetical protein